MLITIELKDNKLNVSMSDDTTYVDAILALASTIQNVTNTIIDEAVKKTAASKKKLTKKQATALRDELAGDLADRLNFLFTNVLESVCPKSSEMNLSEIAIATMENEILNYAAEHKIPLKDAIKEYEARLTKSEVAPPKPSHEDLFEDDLK